MVDSKGLFNGHPMSHWNKLADEYLMELLVSESSKMTTSSIIGALVAERLENIAKAINPVLFKQAVDRRASYLENVAMVLGAVTVGLPKTKKRSQ